MKKIFSIFFLFFSLGLDSAVEGEENIALDPSPSEAPVKLELKRHFPLKSGTVWKYNSNLGEVISRVTVEGERYIIHSESSPMDLTRYLRLGEKGILMTGGKSKIYFISTERTYYPPLLRFPYRIGIGESWKWEGKELVDGEIISSRVTGIIEKREKVRVPAGEFVCLKVKVETVSDDGTTSTSIQWLAPDVGIVKGEVAIDAAGFSGFLIDLLGFDHYNLELTEMEVPED